MAMSIVLSVANERLLSLGSQDGHRREERKARFGAR
jgi:hypothetical protein